MTVLQLFPGSGNAGAKAQWRRPARGLGGIARRGSTLSETRTSVLKKFGDGALGGGCQKEIGKRGTKGDRAQELPAKNLKSD